MTGKGMMQISHWNVMAVIMCLIIRWRLAARYLTTS